MALLDSPVEYGSLRATPFHLLDEEELREVLAWRNDDRIRPWMDNPKRIGLEEHYAFVEKLRASSEKAYFRVTRERAPIGVVSLTDVDQTNQTAQLGIYKSPFYAGGQIGPDLMTMLEVIALKVGIQRLVLRVRKGNEKAIHLYERTGYHALRETEEHLIMEKKLS